MMKVTHIAVATILLACTTMTQGTWTDCSVECGGGTRTNNQLTIDCHDFSCSYESSCPCAPTDMIIVMDESGSVGSDNFWKQKQFAVDVVDGSRYSDIEAATDTRVGFVLFSSTVRTEFDLVAGYTANLESTSDRIWAATYNSGGTSTWLGLDQARSMLLAQGKNDHTWVVVVITDGRSSNSQETSRAASDLQAIGASVYAIGVGNADEDELNAIASDPDEKFMFHVSGFGGLGAIIEELLNGVCCDTTPPVCDVVANSPCSVSCGGGSMTEYKKCSYYNMYNELLRDEWLNSTTACNTQECPPVCEVMAHSDQCSLTCGGGIMTEFEKCSFYSNDGQLIRDEWTNSTVACCTQECPPLPPTTEDCAKCDYQTGVAFLQDPADCQCYYRCQDYGNHIYRIYPQECCMQGLYWDADAQTCNYGAPAQGCMKDPQPNICAEFPPLAATTTTTTTTTPAPCPYTRDPNNPANYLDAEGELVGTCSEGFIFATFACTCLTAPPQCEDNLILHYTFNDSLNDVACSKAYSELWPRHQVNVWLIDGGKLKCAHYNNMGFLSVAFMNNYFSGRAVTHWSISMWYRRTGDVTTGVGLINNGDCGNDPSFAMYIDDDENLVAVLRTSDAPDGRNNSISVTGMHDVWVHVAMTYDGQYLRVYRNGAPNEHLQPITGTIENKQCNMKIGHQMDLESETQGFFHGEMDEILVYDKTLSDADILSKYNNP